MHFWGILTRLMVRLRGLIHDNCRRNSHLTQLSMKIPWISKPQSSYFACLLALPKMSLRTSPSFSSSLNLSESEKHKKEARHYCDSGRITISPPRKKPYWCNYVLACQSRRKPHQRRKRSAPKPFNSLSTKLSLENGDSEFQTNSRRQWFEEGCDDE